MKHYKRQSCAVLSFREQLIIVSRRGHRETRSYSIKDSHLCVCVRDTLPRVNWTLIVVPLALVILPS